jgi:dihydrofolate reductase
MITIIVAVADNGVIGNAGKIPWHLREDLQRFKRLTMGHPIVMGRRTWESIGRPLPGRESIVVTRQQGYRAEGARVAGSLKEALDLAGRDAFVIGGGEIYREALPLARRVELTRVHASPEGDATFPSLGPEWREVAREEHPEGSPPYGFVTLERRGASS